MTWELVVISSVGILCATFVALQLLSRADKRAKYDSVSLETFQALVDRVNDIDELVADNKGTLSNFDANLATAMKMAEEAQKKTSEAQIAMGFRRTPKSL